MKEHKGTVRQNKEVLARKHRPGKREPQPLPGGLRPREQDLFMDTPFLPRTESHAETLAMTPPGQTLANFVQQLQRTYGNRYVQHLVDSLGVQGKLTVGHPGDIHEQEADRVANTVTRAMAAQIHLQPGEEEEELQARLQRQEEEEELQMKLDSEIQRQEDIPGGPEKPPKTTKDPQEIATKVLGATLKTETGKKVISQLKKASTKEGAALIGILTPVLSELFAANMDLPKTIVGLVPKVARVELGKDIELGFQPIYRGKLGEKPKEWGGMLTLTIRR